MGKAIHFPWGRRYHGVINLYEDTIGWESDGKKYPYFGESMGTNFPGSFNSMDFAEYSNAMETDGDT